MRKHFAKTNECLIETRKVVETYVAGDLETADQAAQTVIDLESEADNIKREVRSVLFSGAFLPNIRSDVYRLVESVDAVADKGETVAHFIVNQNPRIPDEFQAELIEITGQCLACYNELRQGLKSFFKPKGEIENLQQHSTRVGELETEVDGLYADLTRRIFSSGMDLGEKIHFCQLLNYISRIADAAEDAADELEFAAMKSVL